ncbi:MAG: hypothetical protein ACOYN3_07055 [Acidimicrobiia bacterium]
MTALFLVVLSVPLGSRVAAGAMPVALPADVLCGASCAPPSGGLPGLHPAHLAWGDIPERCDGTEPEFAEPAGAARLDVTERAHPALQRTYSWYTKGSDPTPIRWIAHCDERWVTQVQMPQFSVRMPEPESGNAIVPAQLEMREPQSSITSGVVLALPEVALPRRANSETPVVRPSATIIDIAWSANNGCSIQPIVGAPASVIVNVPATTALPCVQANVAWELSATREPASAPTQRASAPIDRFIGLNGVECVERCVMSSSTSTSATLLDRRVTAALASAHPTADPSPSVSASRSVDAVAFPKQEPLSLVAGSESARAVSVAFSRPRAQGWWVLVALLMIGVVALLPGAMSSVRAAVAGVVHHGRAHGRAPRRLDSSQRV